MAMHKQRFVIHWFKVLTAWRQRYRERRALLALDDQELKDMGFTRGDAYREGTKPFWQA